MTWCKSRVHCVACRQDELWRESLLAAGLVEMRDFECKWGVTKETALTTQTHALVALATTQEQLTNLGKSLRQSSKSCCGQKEIA